MNIHEITNRAKGNVPRVHGNGFLQLDLNQGSRLHVWGHRDLPRQRVDTGIHDHRFGFVSTVLVGRVVNANWLTIETSEAVPTHKIYTAVVDSPQSHNTTLSDSGERVHVYIENAQIVLRGEKYRMYPGMFHETFTDRPSATIMQKTTHLVGHSPRVLVPLGQEPDNEFHRDEALPQDRLWEIIEEVLSLISASK